MFFFWRICSSPILFWDLLTFRTVNATSKFFHPILTRNLIQWNVAASKTRSSKPAITNLKVKVTFDLTRIHNWDNVLLKLQLICYLTLVFIRNILILWNGVVNIDWLWLQKYCAPIVAFFVCHIAICFNLSIDKWATDHFSFLQLCWNIHIIIHLK